MPLACEKICRSRLWNVRIWGPPGEPRSGWERGSRRGTAASTFNGRRLRRGRLLWRWRGGGVGDRAGSGGQARGGGWDAARGGESNDRGERRSELLQHGRVQSVVHQSAPAPENELGRGEVAPGFPQFPLRPGGL